MREELDAKIEALLRGRRLEPASADLKQRIVQKALGLQRIKMVGTLNDFRGLTHRGLIRIREKKR